MERIKDFKSFEKGFYREITNTEYHRQIMETDVRGFHKIGPRIVKMTDSEKSKISKLLSDITIVDSVNSPKISIEMTRNIKRGGESGYSDYDGDDLLIQVFIYKNDDEYYYVNVTYVDVSDDFTVMEQNYYECDQFDGLLKFLKSKFF